MEKILLLRLDDIFVYIEVYTYLCPVLGFRHCFSMVCLEMIVLMLSSLGYNGSIWFLLFV